jgi:GH43 family beta-xylosidase
MQTYHNPLPQRADDPWIVRDGDSYLYCYSIDGGVAVTRSDSLIGIKRERGAVCYRAPKGEMYSEEYWAPELHKIAGRWYIYVAADDGNNDNHRMYCLGAKTDDPTGEYEMLGKITDDTDKWAIDGTILPLNGENYFIWSGWEGDVNVAQKLYIAHMKDAVTIDSPRVLISEPEYEWEKRCCTGGLPTINEGPAVLARDGKVYLVYSASGSWSDEYCLGMLELVGKDPMNPDSWKKHDGPVFEKNEYCYGPGHCSFTTSPDGTEDWMAYHGNPVSGSGWGGRRLYIQRIYWENDTPVFGAPTAPDQELFPPLGRF